MSGPTAAEVIEQLRVVYEEQTGERLSDEKLAAKLPIGLSTFNRWKKSDTRAFRDVVDMLALAGWLNTPEDARALARTIHDPREELAAALLVLQEGQRVMLESLQVGQDEILAEVRVLRGAAESTPPVAPRRRRLNS